MANRPHLLTVSMIAAAHDGVHSDGGALDGCALEIHIRNGGKSKRGYFRYNGTQFGEKRTERISLGSYDLGFPALRRERVACEDLIEQGKSPKLNRSKRKKEIQKQHAAAKRTLRQALDEFFAWAGGDAENPPARWQSPHTRKNTLLVKKKYFDTCPFLDEPLQSITFEHINIWLKPYWGFNRNTGTKGSIGMRLRSLLHSTFDREIGHGRYTGHNPASWHDYSPLSKELGPEPRYTPHPAADYNEIATVVAHLRQARECVPGYLSTAEAAYALDRDDKSIRGAVDAGELSSVILRPHHSHGRPIRFYPIADLNAVFGEFKRTPIALQRADVVLNCEALLAIIFTAVRPHMICELCWRQINEKKGYIEYLPARNGQPSEHKNGWKYNFPYLVMLTDNLRAIIEIQRRQQIQDGVEIKPDGLVFRHARTRSGRDYYFGQGVGPRTLSDYLHVAVADLKLETKDMTPAGMRATFGHWAKNEHGYSDELVNLALGHIIPALRENSSNWSYLYDVQRRKHRHEMMTLWEQHCLSPCNEPHSIPENLLSFPPTAASA